MVWSRALQSHPLVTTKFPYSKFAERDVSSNERNAMGG